MAREQQPWTGPDFSWRDSPSAERRAISGPPAIPASASGVRCRRRFRLLGLLCFGPLLGLPLAAQTPASSSPDGILTLNVQSRLVVEDVLVTDRSGKPVHGLPQSAFHIFDQDKPQTIRGFEEGLPPDAATAVPALPPLDPGTFSNDPARDNHGASEVLLIDVDGMSTVEQMFLLDQLRRAIAAMPANLPAALFRVSNGRPVQIRGFTTDQADLRRGAEECLPFLTHAIDSSFQSGLDQLMAVTGYLEQRPGRKNLLWFTGTFPLVPVSEDELRSAYHASPDFVARQRIIHQAQEALAEARISVFPIDVRGVLTTPLEFHGTAVFEERDQMHQLANATGGKAYMLNNLATEIDEALDLGRRAYTLSYTPSNYTTDESWHRVSIHVDGNYHLSYRPGYLATFTGIADGRQGFKLENGRKVATETDPEHLTEKPILFHVQVVPAPDQDGTVERKGPFHLALHFQIPADQLKFAYKQGKWTAEVLVSSWVYDGTGKVRSSRLQEVDLALTDEQRQRALRQQLPAEQEFIVPKGAGYLIMAVRDKQSKRIGSLMLSTRALRSLPPTSSVANGSAQPASSP